MPPMYDFTCEKCENDWMDNIRFEKRFDQICPFCGEKAIWKFPAPSNTRASYVDGTRRFDNVREAAALNKEAITSRSKEKKKEIAAEIRKLGVRVNKRGDGT